jgi:hypothetical protein
MEIKTLAILIGTLQKLGKRRMYSGVIFSTPSKLTFLVIFILPSFLSYLSSG